MELDRPSRSKKRAVTTRLRKEQMTTVVWTTPLGLPIVQPYRKIKRKQIMTSMQSVYISDPNAPAEGEHSFSSRDDVSNMTNLYL
jgi:DNA-directed RNA polymerase